MNRRLLFDREAHAYRLDGIIVPSVTECLKIAETFTFGRGDAASSRTSPRLELFERARRFGNHVHAATDLFDHGILDEDALDAPLVPYLNAWKLFLLETGFKVTRSEERVFHPTMKYAGTLDRRGIMRNSTWCLDIKTGAIPRTVGPQTAAYAKACEEPPRRRLCVQLRGDGSYKMKPCNDTTDFAIFTSCLNLWNWFNAIDKTSDRTVDSAA